jgi:hypothetical protein
MLLLQKMDETLISWIDNDTESTSFHSPDSITSQIIISPKLTSPKYIEIKEENIPKRPTICPDEGEICFSNSEEETQQQPNFLIKETDITYIDFKEKEEKCCCIIL